MKKLLKTSLALLSLCGCIGTSSLLNGKYFNQEVETIASDKMISDDEFISVPNFLYSGKGFILEFTYEIPSKETNVQYCFMDEEDGWHRLTVHFTFTFKTDGSITTSIGHLFKIDGHQYFQVMFSELSNYLNRNSGEAADGTENLNGLYIINNDVSFNPVKVEVITSGVNAYPGAEVRNDEILGLNFKAYLPQIISGATYGMCIVPSSYLKGANGDYKAAFTSAGKNFLDLTCNPLALTSSDPIYKTFGNGYYIQASIINILEENYQVPFVAIPYYVLNGKTIYGNLIQNTRISYYEACLKFKNSNQFSYAFDKVKREVENVIYKCENHVTKVLLSNNIKAYFPYNTEKVFKNADLPVDLKTENVMYCAKNEIERGQVVVNVPSNFNKKYFVSVEPFVNTQNSSIRIESKNINIEQQLYQNVKTNWRVADQQQTKWYPDGKTIPNLPLGYVPDALLPFDVAFDANENIFTSDNGNNNAISYTVKVPDNAIAGEYKSKIVIQIRGEGTLALPITLNVFDFKLPEENKAKHFINVNTSETKALYGSAAGSITSTYNQSAYAMLRDRHISGGPVGATCWQINDLPAYIEKVKELAADPKTSMYLLPNSSREVSMDVKIKKSLTKTETVTLDNLLVYEVTDRNYSDTIVLPGLKTILRELVKASTNNLDLLKKGLFYFPQADEPGNNAAKQLQNVFCENALKRTIDELLKETSLFEGKDNVKTSLKNLFYIVTSYPKEYLNGSKITGNDLKSITPASGYESACKACYCDSVSSVTYREMSGYCPTYDSYQPDIKDVANIGYSYLTSRIGNPDYHIWWYGCIQPIAPYPSLFVNGNLIQKRANSWCQYNTGIEGELYYMCNRTQKYENGVSYPLTEQEILEGGATYEETYGDGNLLYPVHRMYGEFDPNLYWLSSLRLDNIAEALDDYNYLAFAGEMIEKLTDSTQQTTYKNQLKNLMNQIGPTPGRNTTDSSLLFNNRVLLGNLIVELSKK